MCLEMRVSRPLLTRYVSRQLFLDLIFLGTYYVLRHNMSPDLACLQIPFEGFLVSFGVSGGGEPIWPFLFLTPSNSWGRGTRRLRPHSATLHVVTPTKPALGGKWTIYGLTYKISGRVYTSLVAVNGRPSRQCFCNQIFIWYIGFILFVSVEDPSIFAHLLFSSPTDPTFRVVKSTTSCTTWLLAFSYEGGSRWPLL